MRYFALLELDLLWRTGCPNTTMSFSVRFRTNEHEKKSSDIISLMVSLSFMSL